MGVIQTVRAALAPSAIRTALRSAPKPAAAQRTQPLPRIGRNGPPVASPMPDLSRHQRLVEYLAVDADPHDWFGVMERADWGDTGPQVDLFCDARVRDSHLDGVASKRAQSMMGRPIVFRPAEGQERDAEALRIAAAVRRILLTESIKFRSMLSHMMAAPGYGYSVANLRWTRNAWREAVPHLEWVHLNRFAFDRDTREIGFYDGPYRSHWKVCKLSEYRDSFVVHMPMGGRSDYPWRRGAMRSCIIPSFIKRQGLSHWLVLTERFGMPQTYAKVPDGLDDDGQSSTSTIATVQEALQNMSRFWALTVSDKITIDAIPGSGNVKADVHQALIDWAETTESIAMLGQNLTTKVEGGSFAAAEAHRYVAGDMHLADAVELGETITQQVVAPLVRYNWPGAPVPVCEISTGQKQVFTTEHVKEGIASPDELRRTMGHEPIPGELGAEYRRPVVVQVPAALEPAAPANDNETAVPVVAAPAAADAEVAAGEPIETEPAAPDEATAKDPSTGLNRAQMAELKQLAIDVATGVLPKASAKAIMLASLPISATQADEILEPIVAKPAESEPAAAPPQF